MKNELRIFFTALMFYTRIPCPKWVDHSPEYINKATRYFPLIGWIVGIASAGVFWAGYSLFSYQIGIIMALIAGVLITGAFHEDGLADMFDGFGGGWTKAKILEIMKDSRVGAYGGIALIFLFALKFFAIQELFWKAFLNHPPDWMTLSLIFVAYHSLARLTAINLVFTMPYAREDAESKAKPIAQEHSYREVLGAYFFGLLPLAVLMLVKWPVVVVFVPLFVLYWRTKRYFTKWLQGYTGDCLGAVEQMAEVVVLLTLVAVWKFI